MAFWILRKNPQAANQIALNLSSMTFMFAMGLGVTAMIRVGNQKGKKDYISLKNCIFYISPSIYFRRSVLYGFSFRK